MSTPGQSAIGHRPSATGRATTTRLAVSQSLSTVGPLSLGTWLSASGACGWQFFAPTRPLILSCIASGGVEWHGHRDDLARRAARLKRRQRRQQWQWRTQLVAETQFVAHTQNLSHNNCVSPPKTQRYRLHAQRSQVTNPIIALCAHWLTFIFYLQHLYFGEHLFKMFGNAEKTVKKRR